MVFDITYAIDENGKYVSIDDIKVRGLACNCKCANCGERLVAKLKGDFRKPHFAHYNPDKDSNNNPLCYEGTLHKLAITVLSEEKCVMLPPLDCVEAKQIAFEEIEPERRNDCPDLQPDIVGITKEGQRIAVEIRHTHEVDDRKLEKILENNITCVEIDISSIPMEKDAIREFLCNSINNREWLNNPKYEQLIVDHYQTKDIYSNSRIIISDKSLNDPMQNHKYIYSGDEIHTFEPYKRKKYYVIAVKQLNPNLKNSHILHTRYPLPISQNEDRIFVKKPGLHTQPPSPNVELLKYYENLRPHQIFDERINSKISNYKIYGNCLAVIHIYQNKAGFYRTRLSLVTENRGKLHFETINDFSTEHAAEHAMLNMLLSHDT